MNIWNVYSGTFSILIPSFYRNPFSTSSVPVRGKDGMDSTERPNQNTNIKPKTSYTLSTQALHVQTFFSPLLSHVFFQYFHFHIFIYISLPNFFSFSLFTVLVWPFLFYFLFLHFINFGSLFHSHSFVQKLLTHVFHLFFWFFSLLFFFFFFLKILTN